MSNPIAVALGKLAKGQPKTLSQAERRRRAKRARMAGQCRVQGVKRFQDLVNPKAKL